MLSQVKSIKIPLKSHPLKTNPSNIQQNHAKSIKTQHRTFLISAFQRIQRAQATLEGPHTPPCQEVVAAQIFGRLFLEGAVADAHSESKNMDKYIYVCVCLHVSVCMCMIQIKSNQINLSIYKYLCVYMCVHVCVDHASIRSIRVFTLHFICFLSSQRSFCSAACWCMINH